MKMGEPFDMEKMRERVQQFMSLSLPGQPQGMHMGTSYLVQDLWQEVRALADRLQEADAVIDKARAFGRAETAQELTAEYELHQAVRTYDASRTRDRSVK